MGISQEAQRRIQAQRQLQDQIFVGPEMETSGFPVSPYSPYYRTNNFIQNTISRLVGYNPDEKKWVPAFVDTSGRLLTSPDPTAGTHVFLKDRECITINILEGEVVPGSNAITHVGENIEEFSHFTVLVSSSAAATVYVQCSNDNTNWYEWKSLADADLTFNCNNEKICFGSDDHFKYIRIVILNGSASSNTLSLTILGLV